MYTHWKRSWRNCAPQPRNLQLRPLLKSYCTKVVDEIRSEGHSIFRSGHPSCRWEPLTSVLASQFFESRKYEENYVSKICTTEIIGVST